MGPLQHDKSKTNAEKTIIFNRSCGWIKKYFKFSLEIAKFLAKIATKSSFPKKVIERNFRIFGSDFFAQSSVLKSERKSIKNHLRE